MAEALQFKITLLTPYREIWRRVQIPFNVDFGSFHAVIQVAMGWQNSHLHEFTNGKQRIFQPTPYDDDFMFENVENIEEGEIFLTDVFKRKGKRIQYHYDFGDSWYHEIQYEGKVPFDEKMDYPLCIEGKGACPPEDCGGIYGYEEMLEIIANPEHEEYEDWIEWLGEGFDPDRFDVEEVNAHFASWTEGPISEEEFQDQLGEFLQEVPEEVMNQGQEEFAGLSMNEIMRLVETPFGKESPLKFSQEIPDNLLDQSSYLRVAEFLLSEIVRAGELKLTTKGNLPKKIVTAVYDLELATNYGLEKGIHKVRPEQEMMEVHTPRLLLELGKLIKKRNNKFSLTKKGEKLQSSGRTALFHHLAETFLIRFNLGFWDGFPESPVGQIGVGYLLYLLKIHGKQALPQSFYAEKYLEAFPPMLMEVHNFRPDLFPDFNPADEVEKILTLRLFKRGLNKWGLVEMIQLSDDIFHPKYEIKASPLLDAWLVGKK